MRKIRMGMVGGGRGAFIGEIHRLSASLDGEIKLVCGAFSRNADNCAATGKLLGLAPDRCYQDFKTMMSAEASLPADQRIEFVSIVTPNHLHFPVAKAALEAGFNVLMDKPATLNIEEAIELRCIVKRTGLLFGLTHSYLGYPLVNEARSIIANEGIGKVRKVFVEYIQGWLAIKNESKQADWRTDPERSGRSGCMGDIGTHAHSLAEYIVGKRMTHVAADLSKFVEGRKLDDDGSCLFRMEDGIKGILSASQICAGKENSLSIRIFGEKGGLEWHQEEPNTLFRTYLDRPAQMLRSGSSYLEEHTQNLLRTPMGHPEGYLEAFANIYLDFSRKLRSGTNTQGISSDIDDGVRSMAFIEALINSSENNSKWVEILS